MGERYRDCEKQSLILGCKPSDMEIVKREIGQKTLVWGLYTSPVYKIMNKNLKYFLFSFLTALVFASFVFLVLPYLFASIFSGGLLPFGGLFGLIALVYFLPYFLILGFIIFIIVALIFAEKGNKLRCALITGGSYILAIVIVFSYLSISHSIKVEEVKETINFKNVKIKQAIAEKNTSYCGEIYDSFKVMIRADSPYREINSRHKEGTCYIWYAYSTGDFSSCDKISAIVSENVNHCWALAAIKSKNVSYCRLMSNLSSYAAVNYADCLGALAIVTDNINLCEAYGVYDASCTENYALAKKDVSICEKIIAGSAHDDCIKHVQLLDNLDNLCDEYKVKSLAGCVERGYSYSSQSCEEAAESDYLYCMADAKNFLLDEVGCMDLFKGLNYNYCEKKFKECQYDFVAHSLLDSPIYCDLDYFAYIGRFKKLPGFLIN